MILLQPYLVSLQGALHFNNIASALEAHVRQASAQGWALPRQLQQSAEDAEPRHAGVSENREGISVRGMWPYWLEGRSASTVRNTLNLQNMVILTGHTFDPRKWVLQKLPCSCLTAANIVLEVSITASLPLQMMRGKVSGSAMACRLKTRLLLQALIWLASPL